MKKLTKGKKLLVGIVLLFLLGIILFIFRKNDLISSHFLKNKSFEIKNKNNFQKEEKNSDLSVLTSESEEEKRMRDWLEKCETGDEIVLKEIKEEKQEEISGKIEIDYTDDQDISGNYFLTNDKGEKQKFSVNNPSFMDLLEGRRVILKGNWESGVFYPFVLRCVSTVQSKDQLERRRKIMEEASKKVEEIAGKSGKFIVESFLWQNDDYFYMDFFNEEKEDILYEVLVFVSQKNGENIFERVALFESSEKNGDLELVSGKDIFEDVEEEEKSSEGNYYEYDDVLKAWSPVY